MAQVLCLLMKKQEETDIYYYKKLKKITLTVIWGTPTIWQILIDSGWEKPLHIKALIGGEPVPMPLAHELLELTDELWNIYGPTETTVCAFLTKITKEDNPITIGKPVANTHVYLLNEDGNPVNEGEVGEIVIGGAGPVVDVQNHVLKAYVVPTNADADFAAQSQVWKDSLMADLPSYMVPHEFISLEELPVTNSGKLDRKLLANLNSNNTVRANYNEPRTEAEKIISEIWEESLGLEKVDIFSDFFEIGGHSMVAAKVMTQIEKKTGKRLPLASLFEHSTVEKLALLLHLDDKLITWGSLVPIKAKGNKPPVFIVHGAGLNVLNFNSLAKYVDEDQPIYGLQAKV
ncbi:Dimodular nonribosomal peptide synthase [Nymphon striatum]|nr:Dimodular nonribosomal peptide synthase [Nymphon striatum]